MGPIGFNEILIILVIILLLFGAKKIPELMRGVGKGVREFSDAKNNVRGEIEEASKQKQTEITETKTTTIPGERI